LVNSFSFRFRLTYLEFFFWKKLLLNAGDTYAEIQSIDTNSQELFTGKKKLKDMVDELEREHRQMDSILSVYKVLIINYNSIYKVL
jgi:hypothetical protein